MMEPGRRGEERVIPGISSWERFNRMLESDHGTILGRETNNSNAIHLYSYGAYWTAFEQSAYQLCRLFRGSSTAILQIKGYPFPAVMAFLPGETLQRRAGSYTTQTISSDYKILSVPSLTPARYRSWYTRLMKEHAEIQRLIGK